MREQLDERSFVGSILRILADDSEEGEYATRRDSTSSHGNIKQSNNIGIVDRIVRYIQRSPTSSRTVIPHSSTTEGSSSNVSLSYDAAKICAGFLQMTAFLENMDEQGMSW